MSDHTMFIKYSFSRKKIIFIVYVDDIILPEDNIEEI